MKAYTDALNVLQKKFDEDVSDLAEKIRQEVIKPVCEKHKLRFLSGMGTFFFYRGKKTYGAAHDQMSDALRADIMPIIDLLNTEVSHNQVLGYFVIDFPTPVCKEVKKS